MWYALKTQSYKEEEAKKLLKTYVNEVKEVYIPYLVQRTGTGTSAAGGRIVPALKGYLFVNMSGDIRQHLDSYGRFVCRYEEFFPKTGRQESVSVCLLGNNIPNRTLDDLIGRSKISDAAMLDFRDSMDQIAGGIGDMRIEQESFERLAEVNDVVVVLQGPMKGREGVIKRVKDEAGKRDRRFYISLGNNLCISLSGIHQNDIAVVHEATESEAGRAVNLWRTIDRIEGTLQKNGFTDDAPRRLRELIMLYNKDVDIRRTPGMDDKEWVNKINSNIKENEQRKTGVLNSVEPQDRTYLKKLGEYFKKIADKNEKGLEEFIPDKTLRPFLTPTSGKYVPEDDGYAILHHNNFAEYIIRKDLSSVFRHGRYEKEKYNAVHGEDYTYYAHVAVFRRSTFHRAVVSWGEFYNQYALLEEVSKRKFLDDLKKYRYNKLYDLLNADVAGSEEKKVHFGQTEGIGGFYTNIDGNETEAEAAQRLVNAVAPAAVEMWQGTRMRVIWRTLLQRHVLLHKIPVRYLPSVIPYSEKIDNIFRVKDADGQPDIQKIAELLQHLLPQLKQHLTGGKPYEAAALFLQTAQGIATHFTADEHWNNLNGTPYRLDEVCTEMADTLFSQSLPPDVRKYLLRGTAELQATDTWRYFHLPTALKAAKKYQDVKD